MTCFVKKKFPRHFSINDMDKKKTNGSGMEEKITSAKGKEKKKD